MKVLSMTHKQPIIDRKSGVLILTAIIESGTSFTNSIYLVHIDLETVQETHYELHPTDEEVCMISHCEEIDNFDSLRVTCMAILDRYADDWINKSDTVKLVPYNEPLMISSGRSMKNQYSPFEGSSYQKHGFWHESFLWGGEVPIYVL